MRKLVIAFAAVAVLSSPGVSLAGPEYSVADLLQPCKEGDNDSRGGAVLELECEQYISGFTDLYIASGLAAKDKVCLPEQNQEDEVRWAFMRWSHQHYDDRDQPAVAGLMKTVKTHFPCK